MELLLLVGLVVILCYILRKKDPLNELPGPKAFPLVGNALQIDAKKIFVDITELGKQYGGVYKIHFFMKPVVVVNDTDLIYEVLVKRSADFAGRPNTYLMKFLSENLQGVVASDPTKEEKSRRKVMHAYLRQFGTGIQKIEEVTLTATDDLINRIAEQNGCPMNIRDLLMHCVFDVMMIFLLGETISKDEMACVMDSLDRVNESITTPSGLFLDMFPPARFFGNKTYKELMDTVQVKYNFVSRWMEGFINLIQSMTEEEKKNSALDTELAQHNLVWSVLAAGIFTTSTTLSCLINVLAQNPDVQEKLRKEIMDIIGPSRYPSLKDQDDLPYLRATILEIGRFASIAPFAVPHKVLETSSVGGFKIPKDTEVWVNLWAMHHDEKLRDEPFIFKPERFLDAEGQLLPADHPNRKNLMPFGAGQHGCVREVFALKRMLLIMARILQNFSLLPESTLEKQPSCNPRDMIMGLLVLPQPFKVRIVPVD